MKTQTDKPTKTASAPETRTKEMPSNRYEVITRFTGEYGSTVHAPTGQPRWLNVGDIIVHESTAPNGNVWFHDSDGERFKVESGSLGNMSDRVRQLTFEEVNRRNQRTLPAEKPTTWKQQADKQLSALIATLEKMATCEAAAGDGVYATDHLSNIRYVLNKLYEAKDAMEVL